jgi:hypothetical protein
MDQGSPNHFYIVYYPSDPNYFYCFYPIGWNLGFYWCRCFSPNYPEYDPSSSPSYFSRLPNLESIPNPTAQQMLQYATMYPTIQAAAPNWQPFAAMPAHYPPSLTVPMQNLPTDLPPAG